MIRFFIALFFILSVIAISAFADPISDGLNQIAIDFYNGNVFSISIASTPYKTTYDRDDKLDLAGLSIFLNKRDGSTEQIIYSDINSNLFAFVPTLDTRLTPDIKEVYVAYLGFATAFSINVNSEPRAVGPTYIGAPSTYKDPNADAAVSTAPLMQYASPIQILNPAIFYDSTMEFPFGNTGLTYTLNRDGTATFSNGLILYPDGRFLDASGNVYNSDGSITTTTGITYLADGSVKDNSGKTYNLDGTISLPEGNYIDTNGLTHYNDGSVMLADGTIYNADGSITYPNGTVLDNNGRIIKKTKKAKETEERERARGSWKYDPIANNWQHVENDISFPLPN